MSGLTVNECWAAALAEAAEVLSGADNLERFLGAIEINHRLWLILTGVASGFPGKIEARIADFVMSMVYRAGRGIPDRNIEILIEINNHLSATLVGGQDVAAVRHRAELAWRAAAPRSIGLSSWLISEIERLTPPTET
jgi:hypothetical protein